MVTFSIIPLINLVCGCLVGTITASPLLNLPSRIDIDLFSSYALIL